MVMMGGIGLKIEIVIDFKLLSLQCLMQVEFILHHYAPHRHLYKPEHPAVAGK